MDNIRKVESEPWRFLTFSRTRLRYDNLVDLVELANNRIACTCDAALHNKPCRHVAEVKAMVMRELWDALMNTLQENKERSGYTKKKAEFLAKHPQCAVWPDKKAEDIHHSRGRLGDLLEDERFWVPVSRAGHLWVHGNITEARRRTWNGIPLICALGDWNKISVDNND